ncbi:MAG: NACHT domain-containing protein [Planctomycetes bacterium]|nr:NACHT domain-containing protein [Planctomycetota bacterium]
MNEYIVPHIQIRRKRHDPSKEKFPHSNPNPAFNPDELSEKQEYCFDSITVQEIVNSERDYMVVGDLGIGKTSLLLWIAKQVCSECENAEYIPLFIQIKDVSQIQTRDAFFSLLDTRYNLNKYDAEGRRFLFLLDGLDQIGKYGNINNSLKHKDVFGERNKIILTTRPIGYEWIKKDLDPKYEYLQIQLLDNKKIKEYVGDHYNSENFQAILSRNNDLLSVPILLKMVKTLLLNNRLSEIKNRTSLYTTFISYLFEKWERD